MSTFGAGGAFFFFGEAFILGCVVFSLDSAFLSSKRVARSSSKDFSATGAAGAGAGAGAPGTMEMTRFSSSALSCIKVARTSSKLISGLGGAFSTIFPLSSKLKRKFPSAFSARFLRPLVASMATDATGIRCAMASLCAIMVARRVSNSLAGPPTEGTSFTPSGTMLITRFANAARSSMRVERSTSNETSACAGAAAGAGASGAMSMTRFSSSALCFIMVARRSSKGISGLGGAWGAFSTIFPLSSKVKRKSPSAFNARLLRPVIASIATWLSLGVSSSEAGAGASSSFPFTGVLTFRISPSSPRTKVISSGVLYKAWLLRPVVASIATWLSFGVSSSAAGGSSLSFTGALTFRISPSSPRTKVNSSGVLYNAWLLRPVVASIATWLSLGVSSSEAGAGASSSFPFTGVLTFRISPSSPRTKVISSGVLYKAWLLRPVVTSIATWLSLGVSSSEVGAGTSSSFPFTGVLRFRISPSSPRTKVNSSRVLYKAWLLRPVVAARATGLLMCRRPAK
mmetsp:Transcript_24658/g.44768  ORF Transcript_24658/g.44768 Transcript_24658/m.44768 type:complete len:513 (-) Transcript_24658:388-1926(-)